MNIRTQMFEGNEEVIGVIITDVRIDRERTYLMRQVRNNKGKNAT